jgi:hypothetical protein
VTGDVALCSRGNGSEQACVSGFWHTRVTKWSVRSLRVYKPSLLYALTWARPIIRLDLFTYN